MADYEALLIAGPTATGKTGLAIELARALDGVVINADSMQVYSDIDILSGAPSADQKAACPHRLFGVIELQGGFSVAEWHRMADREIKDCWQRDALPIIVGGTGLYFKTLLSGLAPVPEIPDAVRQEIRDRLESEGLPAIFEELQRTDPDSAAQLSENDSQRICRALEVWVATGRSLREWQSELERGALQGAEAKGRVKKLVLDLPRKLLYSRINDRFREMVEAGALDEARKIIDRKVSSQASAMKALGLRPLIAHLQGRMTLEAAIEEAQKLTRNYAKRQMTWFRNQFDDWCWLDPRIDDLMGQLVKNFIVGDVVNAGP